MPNAPPGWNRAKSCAVKPRILSSVIASASPITIWAVVLEVGARLFGQASSATVVFRIWSLCWARNDSRLPTIPISRLPICRMNGTRTLISGELPLFEMQRIMSSG